MSTASEARVSRESLNLPTPYRQPRPGLETVITSAFAKVFNVDGVGADDEFYDLGGDSLLGETLSMEILEATGENFQISWLDEHGTPAKVAKRLAAEVRPNAERPPIFLVHGRGGYASPGPKFRAGLAPGQQVEMFELPGLRGNGRSYNTIEEIAKSYVGRLLTLHPSGPVLLGSFCSGGLIALEMARQLAAAGRPVRHLVLIDPGSSVNVMERHRHEMEAIGLTASDSERRIRKQNKLARFGWRAVTLLALGRITDGSQERDFSDTRLHKLHEDWFYWGERAKQAAKKLLGRSTKKLGSEYSLRAQSRLLVAFQYYWPETYTGTADILCSERRKRVSVGDNEFFGRFVPNRKVTVVGETHHDVIGGINSPHLAAELQRIFDRALAHAEAPAKAAV